MSEAEWNFNFLSVARFQFPASDECILSDAVAMQDAFRNRPISVPLFFPALAALVTSIVVAMSRTESSSLSGCVLNVTPVGIDFLLRVIFGIATVLWREVTALKIPHFDFSSSVSCYFSFSTF